MPRSGRQILGLTFDEPERRVDLIQGLQVRAGLAAREDVVLEHVHHFVGEHVLETAEVAGEREDQPLTGCFGDTAGSFSGIAGDVVLSEVSAGREEDDRLLLAELVVEHARESRVRPLGHPGRGHRALFLFRIVVDEEVLGLEHAPVEVLVLHLIQTEILLCVEASRAQ